MHDNHQMPNCIPETSIHILLADLPPAWATWRKQLPSIKLEEAKGSSRQSTAGQAGWRRRRCESSSSTRAGGSTEASAAVGQALKLGNPAGAGADWSLPGRALWRWRGQRGGGKGVPAAAGFRVAPGRRAGATREPLSEYRHHFPNLATGTCSNNSSVTHLSPATERMGHGNLHQD